MTNREERSRLHNKGHTRAKRRFCRAYIQSTLLGTANSISLGMAKNTAHTQWHLFRHTLTASSYMWSRDLWSQRKCLIYKIAFREFFPVCFWTCTKFKLLRDLVTNFQSLITNYNKKLLVLNLLPIGFIQHSLLTLTIIISYSPCPSFQDFTATTSSSYIIFLIQSARLKSSILFYSEYPQSCSVWKLLVILLLYSVPSHFHFFLEEPLGSKLDNICDAAVSLIYLCIDVMFFNLFFS